MTVHRPPDLPSVRTTGIPMFNLTLGACNLILYIHVLINWQLSKQFFCWPVSPDRIAGSDIDPLSSIVFWNNPLTCCYFSNDRRLKFILFKMHMKYVVFMSRTFELTSDAKIQPAFTSREGNRFLLLSLSRVDHALRPIFMFWLVKIWQVSSCGKFMQLLETCLLIAEADTVLCHLVMF